MRMCESNTFAAKNIELEFVHGNFDISSKLVCKIEDEWKDCLWTPFGANECTAVSPMLRQFQLHRHSGSFFAI